MTHEQKPIEKIDIIKGTYKDDPYLDEDWRSLCTALDIVQAKINELVDAVNSLQANQK